MRIRATGAALLLGIGLFIACSKGDTVIDGFGQGAFDSMEGSNRDIYVSSNGGQHHRLTTEPGEDTCPSWTGNGRWIYFRSGQSGSLQIWKMRRLDTDRPLRDAHGRAAVRATPEQSLVPGRTCIDEQHRKAFGFTISPATARL